MTASAGLGSWFVAEHYEVAGDFLRPASTRGRIYEPFNTPEVLFDLAAVASPEDALEFVHRWGLLTKSSTLAAPLTRGAVLRVQEFDVQPFSGYRHRELHAESLEQHSQDGELNWLGELHGQTLDRLLFLLNRLAEEDLAPESQARFEGFMNVRVGEGRTVVSMKTAVFDGPMVSEIEFLGELSPAEAARSYIEFAVAENLKSGGASLRWDRTNGAFEFGPSGGPLRAAWWHLATLISSGAQVHRCSECEHWFEPTRKGQRFCPPTPPARESNCALRNRQRRHKARSAPLTPSGRVRQPLRPISGRADSAS